MKRGFYADVFSSTKMESAEPLPDVLPADCRLILTPCGKYYLNIPIALKEYKDKQSGPGSFVFIDPGVKNFLTCYDSDERLLTIGERNICRLRRLDHHRRKLQGRIDQCESHRSRYRMRRAFYRLGEKTNRLVSEMHKKAALFLCRNYDHIFIPKLNFHEFGRLSRKSKRCMTLLSHCSFVDRLIMKAAEFKRKTSVTVVTEQWTSKTCSACGHIDCNLNNADIYRCTECGLQCSRDGNGAKNIMLKWMCEQLGTVGESTADELTGALGLVPW